MYTVGYERFEEEMDAVSRRALPKAAAEFLNGIAFEAFSGMKAEVERAFDDPVPFTKPAFRVEKAKVADRKDAKASLFVLPQQRLSQSSLFSCPFPAPQRPPFSASHHRPKVTWPCSSIAHAGFHAISQA